MPSEHKAPITYDKENPFMARLVEKRSLTAPESEKDTRHFVVDISGSGLSYAPGDSFGVYPTNDPGCVDELLVALGWGGDEAVVLPKMEAPISLREAFLYRLSLAQPTKNFLKWLQERVVNAREKGVLDDLLRPEREGDCQEYLSNREYIDLAVQFSSAAFTPQEYVERLRKLQPRLYSIASSPKVYPHEVHLTVAVVRYQTNNRERYGVASTYLADRTPLFDGLIPVFIVHSHFKIPEDPAVDMIMVGPGTGVAPFRAFIQEHVARGGSGRTWLFFGEQRREFDYLYGEEWEEHYRKSVLTRLDLAFSRDQNYKIYVQHKMEQEARELWQWIAGGAYFYVCGDAKRMAKDVEVTLLAIIEKEGGKSPSEAQEFLKQLKKEKRYQKDVY